MFRWCDWPDLRRSRIACLTSFCTIGVVRSVTSCSSSCDVVILLICTPSRTMRHMNSSFLWAAAVFLEFGVNTDATGVSSTARICEGGRTAVVRSDLFPFLQCRLLAFQLFKNLSIAVAKAAKPQKSHEYRTEQDRKNEQVAVEVGNFHPTRIWIPLRPPHPAVHESAPRRSRRSTRVTLCVMVMWSCASQRRPWRPPGAACGVSPLAPWRWRLTARSFCSQFWSWPFIVAMHFGR